MIFPTTYMDRMEAANRRLNAYLKACARTVLELSRSFSDLLPSTMSRKEFKKFLAGTGRLEKYEITERLFPKKKKRGSIRRARIERKWGKFNDPPLPDGVYIDEFTDATEKEENHDS